MLKFIKYHWFGLFISIFFMVFMIEFFLVVFAPHQDLHNRGFVPCTITMAEQIETCGKGKFCILKAVSDNYICDGKVIVSGFSDWIKGKQQRPWSNYMFDPVIDDKEDDEALLEYYQSNPDISDEMASLIRQNEELESKKDEE